MNLLGEIRQSSSARPVWTATVRWWRSSTPRSAASPVRPASWRQRWWKHIEVRLPNGAKMGKDRIGDFMGYNLTIPTRIWKNMIFGSGWKYGVYMQSCIYPELPVKKFNGNNDDKPLDFRIPMGTFFFPTHPFLPAWKTPMIPEIWYDYGAFRIKIINAWQIWCSNFNTTLWWTIIKKLRRFSYQQPPFFSCILPHFSMTFPWIFTYFVRGIASYMFDPSILWLRLS